MISRILQVSLVTSYLREVIEGDDLLQDVWIEGEVSSFTIAASGHAYFTLKDSQALIDGVMWRTTRVRQNYAPKVGDLVVAHGSVSIYDRMSKYQLKTDVVQPAGVGIFQLQLEQLRQRLEAEGLFEPSRKRPLPLFPRRIGVVTSATGAVWHDIQQVIGRRYPLVELILSPAAVQGSIAPASMIRALRAITDAGDIDLVVIARGGGSMEDLSPFNDEQLVRAIFSSPIPVVSAVGHENDTTLADFVADQRAPTPSAAAEMIVPDIDDLRALAMELERRASRAMAIELVEVRRSMDLLRQRLSRASPVALVSRQRVEIADMQGRLVSGMKRMVERKRHQLELARSVLDALEPVAMFRRGYAIVSIEGDRTPVRLVRALDADQLVRATFADGSALARVVSTTASDRVVATEGGNHD